MADNFTEFSEVVPNLSDQEWSWLKSQFEMIAVIDGREHPIDEIPVELSAQTPEWRGCRGLRGFGEYDPEFVSEPEFQFEFVEDDPDEGRYLWIYSNDYGNIDKVGHFVQTFLKRFRPNECWSLTYACTCSKPRVGQFGGGTVIVTASDIIWHDAHAIADRVTRELSPQRQGSHDHDPEPA